MASGKLLLPIAEPVLLSGAPVAGATLQVQIAGGPTLASLFQDAALSNPAANPQTSDSQGRFFQQSTELWADASQAYDCYLTIPGGGSTLVFPNIYLLGAATNISGLAPINSPNFTGVPTAPTPSLNDSSQKLATTNYVQGQGYAVLNSPAFTGTPTAPTAAALTNTTQLATTAFVQAALAITNPTGAATGYVKFLGLILQWVPYSLSSTPLSTQAVTWPITFPTQVLGQPWVAPATGAQQMIGTSSVTTSGATVNKGNENFARTGTIFVLGN